MTDFERLERIGAELAKARKRQEEAEACVKELEKKYREAENTAIHNLVHGANMTPEQLAALIRMSAEEKMGNPGGKDEGQAGKTAGKNDYINEKESEDDWK